MKLRPKIKKLRLRSDTSDESLELQATNAGEPFRHLLKLSLTQPSPDRSWDEIQQSVELTEEDVTKLRDRMSEWLDCKRK